MSGIVGRVVPQPPKEHILAELKDIPWAIKLIKDPAYQACQFPFCILYSQLKIYISHLLAIGPLINPSHH
jgi:hypothetical protein